MAIVMVMAALCMKALVPTGYMVGQDSKVFTVQICHDGISQNMTKEIVIPIKGEHPIDSAAKQGKSDCAFSSLSKASMSGTSPVLLAIALAFILALGFAPVRAVSPRRVSHLRPPLRGPPALI